MKPFQTSFGQNWNQWWNAANGDSEIESRKESSSICWNWDMQITTLSKYYKIRSKIDI